MDKAGGNREPGTAARALRRAAFLLILALTAFRLWYGATTGMANDETYYWQWSRQLAWGYFDQGPGIAFCIRIGTLIFGDTPLGVRFVPILLAAATGWLVFETASRWLGERIALVSLILLSVAPLLSVGGLLATYDNPQVFCWVAALLALTVTVQTGRAGGWYVVGLFVGLGALCKLTAWLFAPCVLIFLLLSPAYRPWLRTPHPYLACALALLIYSPCLVWNWQQDFPSVRHAAALSSRSRGAAPLRWFGDFLGSQAIVLGPLLFLAETGALFVTGRTAAAGLFGPDGSRREEASRFLLAFSAPILLLCVVLSLQSKLEANWPAPAHITGLMAVAAWFDGILRRGKIGGRIAVGATAALSCLLVVLLLFPQVLPKVGITVSAELGQKATETYGWPELMRQVQDARRRLEKEGPPVFVAGTNYRVPSLLAFHLPDRPEPVELFFAARRDHYYLTVDSRKYIGWNALLCLDSDKPEAVRQARSCFETVEALPPAEVYREGFTGPVKRWQLYACRGFLGYDPAARIEGW
ncbi:MAG: glycosyltransferase family 39 protein [Bacteroidia bacterium]|nr:glycosyltransferase family 39 protein [Bacteroidia bacterium]